MNEIHKFSREEEDGSTTYNYAIDYDGIYKTQKLKEYYLFGLKLEKEVWDKRKKLF